MTIVKWLHTHGVKISQKLAEMMAVFESHNPRDIELRNEFMKELVMFTKETLINSYSHKEDEKVAVIAMSIGESAASQNLQLVIDKIQDDLHTIEINDEIDCLMLEVIACTVQSCDE